MDSGKIDLLTHELSQFVIFKCRMFHEGVKLDASGQPIYKDIENDRVFERLPLCDFQIRNKRLGCAHSNVNIKFNQLLNEFLRQNPQYSSKILEIKSRFNSIVSKIYNIDHQMGFVERDIAHNALEVNMDERSSMLYKKQELVEIHDTLMNELNSLKTEVEMFIQAH